MENCTVSILAVYSNNCTFTNNTCSGNTEYGICIISSENNNLSNNKIQGNKKYGVFIVASSKNRIHHNQIINNNGAGSTFNVSHIQAYDNTGTNFWNASTEGNYWSDWTVPDTSPKDGIVDQPYELAGYNNPMDFYPLTTQVVPAFSPAPAIMLAVLLLSALVAIRRRKLY